MKNMREFLEQVVATTEVAEIKEFALGEIEKIDIRNQKRKNTPSKARKENEELLPQVVAVLGETPQRASVIKDLLEENGLELSLSKLTTVLKLGKELGQVTVITPDNRNKPLEYSI